MNTTAVKNIELRSDSYIFLRVLKHSRNSLPFLSILFFLVLGWSQRNNFYLEAETGFGYALGILGGSMMLALLIYPLRKRVRAMERMLSVKFWFRLHMMFGILGPMAILYHANFSLGSTNSNVALACMLLVAGSGVVGRYLYVWIHHGLYGSRIKLSEFKDSIERKKKVLAKYLPDGEQIINEIDEIQRLSISPAKGYLHSLKLRHLSARKINGLRKKVANAIRTDRKNGKRIAEPARKSIRDNLKRYVVVVRNTVDFRVHEQMFSLWHILHLPLFVMMIISGIVHVIVVHMY